MLNYSFIKHPASLALKEIQDIAPGVKLAHALYSSFDKQLVWEALNSGRIELKKDKSKHPFIQKFRKSKGTFDWMRADMISFLPNEIKTKKEQLSLEDELENNMLCLKFPSPYDGLYDVLIFRLDHAGMLGLSKDTFLSAQHKSTIGNLLYRSLKETFRREHNNFAIHRHIINNDKKQRNAISELKSNNKDLIENYQSSLLYFLDGIIKKFKSEEGIDIIIDEATKSYIIDQGLSIERIETCIQKSVFIAMNLSLGMDAPIEITPEHLQMEEFYTETKEESTYNKYGKVIDILNKYEEAAILAQERNWKINGNTVAELCSPPITPSAITFNLKKYKSAINHVLDQYENKWPTLRTEFRPLKNIISNGDTSFSQAKSA